MYLFVIFFLVLTETSLLMIVWVLRSVVRHSRDVIVDEEKKRRRNHSFDSLEKRENRLSWEKQTCRCTCTCSSSVSVSRSGLQIVFSTLSEIESVTLAEKKGEKIKLMKYWKTTNLM